MDIDVAGMKVTLDPKRCMVKATAPNGATSWEKQGVEAVLLFGILAAVTKSPGKSK